MKTNANRNSFQKNTNCKIITVYKDGSVTGNIIFQYIWKAVNPSILAESSSDRGKTTKEALMMSIAIGKPYTVYGKINAK